LQFDREAKLVKNYALPDTEHYTAIYVNRAGEIYIEGFMRDDDGTQMGDLHFYKLKNNALYLLYTLEDVYDPDALTYNKIQLFVNEKDGQIIHNIPHIYHHEGDRDTYYAINYKTDEVIKEHQAIIFTEDEAGKLYYSPEGERLMLYEYTFGSVKLKSDKLTTYADAVFSDSSANAVVYISTSDENLYGYINASKKIMLANKDTDIVRLSDNNWENINLGGGDVAVAEDGQFKLSVYRRTEERFPDLTEFYVDYSSTASGEVNEYISYYNAEHADFIAVSHIYADDILHGRSSDVYVGEDFSAYDAESSKKVLYRNLYEFMGEDFFDSEHIMMNILKSNETDGGLYTFSPVWHFDVMTAAAGAEEMIFPALTRSDAFNMMFPYVFNNCFDFEKETVTIDRATLKELLDFADNYPSDKEYENSLDYDKHEGYSIIGDNYGYGYYSTPWAIEYNQFTIEDFRTGRYNAAIWNGMGLETDIYVKNNLFVNFSAFVNVLYKGDFTLPGFDGGAKVIASPVNRFKFAVLADSVNNEGAKSFVEFYMTEYDPYNNYSLSADVLKAEAAEALTTPRTHKRGNKTVRDTIWFSNNDYIEIPDVSEAEVNALLDAILNDSIAYPNGANIPDEYTGDFYVPQYNSYGLEAYYNGVYSFEDFATAVEENLAYYAKADKDPPGW
jgi:hypothetical protein